MINEIVYKKVGEWEPKGSRKELLNKINEWLSQFEKDEQEEMLSLLSHFDYYSKNNIEKDLVLLYKNFRKQCPNGEFVYGKVEKEVGVGFSDIFFGEFWRINSLYDSFQNNLSNIIKEDEIQNIAIVDDYFGTGKTIIKYLLKLLQLSEKFRDKNIFILALQGSYIGKLAIEKFANDNDLTVTVIANKFSKKAYESDNIYSLLDVDSHRSRYSDIYDKKIDKKDFKFGYDEIEALVSFYYNTPNNTLGLFWQNVCGFKGLFDRYVKKKTTLSLMQKKIEERKNLQKLEMLKNIEEYKIEVFAIYILAKQDKFNEYEACIEFGFTEKQIKDVLDYMLAKNYLKCDNGKYIVTDIMRNKIYVSKIGKFKKQMETIADNKINTISVKYVPRNFQDKFSGYKKS